MYFKNWILFFYSICTSWVNSSLILFISSYFLILSISKMPIKLTIYVFYNRMDIIDWILYIFNCLIFILLVISCFFWAYILTNSALFFLNSSPERFLCYRWKFPWNYLNSFVSPFSSSTLNSFLEIGIITRRTSSPLTSAMLMIIFLFYSFLFSMFFSTRNIYVLILDFSKDSGVKWY